MKHYFLMLAALSLLISGCGKNEEPEAAKTDETTMESAQDNSAETEAPAAADEAAAEEAPSESMAASEAPAADAAPAAPESTAQAGADNGKKIYDSVCFACHAQGVAGAPKLDDKAAWAPRIAQGMDTLVSHAVNGFQGSTGVMPPKGGRMDLTDEEVAAAVKYMVEQAK